MPEAIAMLRVGQLLLGSIIGLVCIYLSYKLFAQIPVTVTNDGHFKMPKIGEVKLKVAPGVFFAILGAAIVYFSIDRPITISSDTSSTGGADSASAKAKSFGYETTPSGSHFKYGQQGK